MNKIKILVLSIFIINICFALGPNRAAGRIPTLSGSTNGGGVSLWQITDQVYGTWWYDPTQNVDRTFYIDLGAVYEIVTLRYKFIGDFTDIYTSPDNSTWTKRVNNAGTTVAPYNQVDFTPIPVRYLKITIPSYVIQPQIDEIQAYETDNQTFAWTGETNYTTSGVYPFVAHPNTATDFTFRVKYTDAYNRAPGVAPQLHILNLGSEISGSPFTTGYVTGSYNTGATYSYTKSLSLINDNYTYYFTGTDALGQVVIGAPTSSTGGPNSVPVPTLTWTSETNYTASGVYPVSGPTNASMVFRVNYTSSNNYAPLTGYPKLHIFKSGSAIAGSPFNMNEVDVSDTTYTDGKLFSYSIAFDSEGNDYTYYFEAYDGLSGGLATGIATVSKTGPTISNSFPTLTWTGENCYETVGVFPIAGLVSNIFNFRIKYTDANNYAPAYIRLHILKTGSEIAGSPFNMNEVDVSDTTYTDGKLYSYSIALNSSGNDYAYFFEAMNTNSYSAGGAGASSVLAPSVNNTLSNLSNVTILPALATPTTSLTYIINYTHAGNLPPVSGYPKVHILKNCVEIASSPFTMNNVDVSDTTYTDGKLYSYNTVLPSGVYTCFFAGYDSSNFASKGVGINTVSAQIVSQIPTPACDISTYNAVADNNITLFWSATSPDGLPLTFKLYTSLDGITYTNIYTGASASFKLTNLSSSSKYYWYVEALDPYGQKSKSSIFTFSTASAAVLKLLNYPNPFDPRNTSTTIKFYADKNNTASFEIYTETGKKVFSTSINALSGGNSYIYDGKDSYGNILENGSYIAVIKQDNVIFKHIILILKR